MMSSTIKLVEIEELIEQILMRIPAKPLLRFKSVCKQWLLLISNPRFCASHFQLHHSFNPSPTALLLYDFNDDFTQLPVVPLKPFCHASKHFVLKDYFNIHRARILQSCNGLFLCRPPVQSGENLRPSFQDSEVGCAYLICNPTTGKFKRLSVYSLIKERLRIHGNQMKWYDLFRAWLVFDPTTSPYYKLILVYDRFELKDSTTYILEIFIYSSETDSWISQKIDVSVNFFVDDFHHGPSHLKPFCHFPPGGIYCNGVIHLVKDPLILPVVGFDIDTLTFKKLNLPSGTSHIASFCESGGHLYCRRYMEDYMRWEFDVMEIAADYSRLSVIKHVNLQSLIPSYESKEVIVMRIIADKNEDKLLLVIAENKSLVSYDLSSGDCVHLRDTSSRYNNFFYRVYPYLENLVCV